MSNESEHNSDGPGFFGGEMRVDPPHAAPKRILHAAGERSALQPIGVVADAQASAGTNIVEHSLELLREHAAQLADRLQGEQTALDRRQHE
jgi:hypothetical protein